MGRIMSKRYTLGTSVYLGLHDLLDDGNITDAYASAAVIDNISDACEIDGGRFYGGYFKGGTYSGGDFYDGMYTSGTFHSGTYYDGVYGKFLSNNYYGGTYYGVTFDSNKAVNIKQFWDEYYLRPMGPDGHGK